MAPITDVLMVFMALFLSTYQISKYVCFTEHRIISDKEYLESFVDGMLKSGSIKLHSWDNTVESYLASHPDCCSVSSYAFLNNIQFGFGDDVVVSIDYEMSEKQKASGGYGNDTHYTYIAFLDACGKQFDSTGESFTPTPKNYSTY